MAAAQQSPGPMTTDRPDQTESSVTVPRGFVQLELGIGFTRDAEGEGTVEFFEAPPSLLRVGILQRIEGRLGFAGWQRVDLDGPGGAESVSGLGDLEVGVKVQLLEERGAAPGTAFILSSTLPTGREGIGSERADPSFLGSFSHTLSPRAALGYNAGVRWNTRRASSGDTETAIDALYSLVLGLGLAERVGAFIEAFGTIGLKDEPSDQLSVDGGFTILARDNLQLDVSGGAGLTAAADDWFVALGASLRVPR